MSKETQPKEVETTYNKEDSLATKLAKAGKEVGVVKKDGKNSQQGYSFIKYAAVGGRIREVFEKHHIIIVPEVDSYAVEEIENKYGNKGYHYTLWMKFLVINGDKPDETMERKWLSEAADYGDKGINKAETAATKYFLMRLLNITEIGEKEADEDTPEMVRRGSKAQAKLSQQQVAWLIANLTKYDGLNASEAKAKVDGMTVADAQVEANRLKELAKEETDEPKDKDLEALANAEIQE